MCPTFRLARQTLVRPGPDPILQDLAYTYDAAGQLVQITDAAPFGNAAVSADGYYEYDGLGQLASAEGREHPGQQPNAADPALLALGAPGDLQALARYHQEYAYDEAGNLLSVRHRARAAAASWTRTCAYAPGSNRLEATRAPGDPPGQLTHRYRHDAAGNLVAMPHLPVLGWDHANRLQATRRQVAGAGSPETTYYAYDAAGQRVRKVTLRQAGPGHAPTRKTERLDLGGLERYREYAADGTTVTLERQTLHVMGGARRVALVETTTVDTSIPPAAFTPTSRLRYQAADHLGSATLELDANARVISYEAYYPFGATAVHAADAGAEVSRKRYRYTGKERDDETGFAYHGARYYAPWLGRWTRPDPAGLVDGTNRYRYARNNPIGHSDASGTQSDEDLVDPQASAARTPRRRRSSSALGASPLGNQRPEELSGGASISDNDVYGAIGAYHATSAGLEQRYLQRTAKPFQDRYSEAVGLYAREHAARPHLDARALFELGSDRGLFVSWEARDVARRVGAYNTKEQRETQLEMQKWAQQQQDRFIAEAEGVKFQVTGNAINGIIAAPLATAIDIGNAAKACAQGREIDCIGAVVSIQSLGSGGPIHVARRQLLGTLVARAEQQGHLVLGLRGFGLEDTAAKVGGRTLLSDPNWKETLLAAIRNPSYRFSVSLEGLSGESTYGKVMRAVQQGLSPTASPTNWELAQLYQGGRLGEVTFVNRVGVPQDNPFK